MFRAFKALLVLMAAISGPSVGAKAEEPPQIEALPGLIRACEPSLPILFQSVPSDIEENAIRSCEIISSPSEWLGFCAEVGVACDPYDESFFDDWTMVAVVIDTESPRLCENAGAVPGWALSCLTLRGAVVRARVEVTLAGAECNCSMNPQFPLQLVVVEAIGAGRVRGCRAWPEVHRIECLGR